MTRTFPSLQRNIALALAVITVKGEAARELSSQAAAGGRSAWYSVHLEEARSVP